MNKSKLVILLAFIITIIVGIIYIIPESTPSKINVVITILDNQNLNTYSNQVIEKSIEEIMKDNPIEIDISLLTTSKNNKHKVTIKMKPGDAELNWKNEVKKTFEKLLKDSTINNTTNQSINDLFMQTLEMIKDNSKEEGNYVIITGSFPECYSKNSSLELKNKIIEVTKGIQTKSKMIWSVLDTRENEVEILKSMISSNLCSIIDRRIIFDKSRECTEKTSQQVFCIFFDKLDNDKGKEFTNFLKNNFGENNILTIWNDGPQNNKKFNLSQKDSSNLDLLKILNELEKGKWTSIGYLLKQASNNFIQMPDSITKNLIISGNLPLESKGNQLDSETWKILKSIKNLNIILYHSSNVKDNETDKEFIYGLKYYKINFKKN